MKSREQLKFEALKRQEQIAKKAKRDSFNKAGNVKTSWNRNNKEFLVGMGFYVKGEKARPSKNAWIEKKLDKNVIEIDVRKKV